MKFLRVVAVLSLTFCASVFADEIDDIEADIASKWDKLQSMSYDMETMNAMSGEGMDYNATSKGTAEMARKDAKSWNMRMESTSDAIQKIQGTETKTKMTTLMVMNGDVAYSLNDTNGTKMATKMKMPEYGEMAGGKGFFKWLRKDYTLKVLPQVAISGETCYVVEATAKPKEGVPADANAMPMTYFFSKGNGMVMQTTAKSANGKNTMTMTLKNMKIDPSIAADRFVFTAPAGVVVQDMTDMEAKMKKMQEDAAAAQKKAIEDAEKSQADAKKEEPKEEPKTAAKKEEKKEEPKKEEPKEEKKKKVKVKGFGF